MRPQIPSYSVLSAYSLSYYVVCKFPVILYCQQILVYYKLSASSTKQIHVSDSSILNKSENSFIFIVCKFTLILYFPQFLVYPKLSASIIQQKHVSDSTMFNMSTNFFLFYIVRKIRLLLYCPQFPSTIFNVHNFIQYVGPNMCIVSSTQKYKRIYLFWPNTD